MSAGNVSDVRTFGIGLDLTDRTSKPLAAVEKGWNRMTDAAARGSSRLQKGFKTVADTGKKTVTAIKETAFSLVNFAKTAASVASVIGGAAIVTSLLGALFALVKIAMKNQQAFLDLATTMPVAGASMSRAAAVAQNLSIRYGEDYTEMMKLVGAVADARPVMREGADSFSKFMNLSQDFAFATGQSAESVAGLFGNLEQLGMKTNSIRRLGDSMKYWADRTSMTNGEMMSLVQTASELVKFLPQEAREKALGQFTGIAAIFKDALGDPSQLQTLFGDMGKVFENNQAANWLSGMMGGSPAEIRQRLQSGDYAEVFKMLVAAAKQEKKRWEGSGVDNLSMISGQLQGMTGISGEVLQALAGVNTETIDAVLQANKVKDAADKAAETRRASLLRRWESIKQRFMSIINKISTPLLTILNKIMKPLEDVMVKLSNATVNFVDAMMKPGTANTSWWDKLKDAASQFWKELSGGTVLDGWWGRVKAWFERQDFWGFIKNLVDKYIAPALQRALDAINWFDTFRGKGKEERQRMEAQRDADTRINAERKRVEAARAARGETGSMDPATAFVTKDAGATFIRRLRSEGKTDEQIANAFAAWVASGKSAYGTNTAMDQADEAMLALHHYDYLATYSGK